MLLIFSTSSVGRLWVSNYLRQFSWGGLSRSMWSFLRSSIRVRVFLEGICRWISWSRIHVFHHGLAFSNLIFFRVVLSKWMYISAFRPSSSPTNSFVILLIHSALLKCCCYNDNNDNNWKSCIVFPIWATIKRAWFSDWATEVLGLTKSRWDQYLLSFLCTSLIIVDTINKNLSK